MALIRFLRLPCHPVPKSQEPKGKSQKPQYILLYFVYPVDSLSLSLSHENKKAKATLSPTLTSRHSIHLNSLSHCKHIESKYFGPLKGQNWNITLKI